MSISQSQSKHTQNTGDRGSAGRMVVQVVAALERDSTAIAAVLERAGIHTSILPDIRECSAQIESAGALLITEEALAVAAVPDLLDALRAQPSWCELPVIILTNKGKSHLSGLVEKIAEAAHGVTLVERPIGTTTLSLAAQVAVRLRERQYQVRDLLEEQERGSSPCSKANWS